MSEYESKIEFGGVALNTAPGLAQIVGHKDFKTLTPEDIGNIAEWLAVAWENLAGEQYRPVVISERGYVADEGVAMPALDFLEKRLASIEYDGNGVERDCE